MEGKVEINWMIMSVESIKSSKQSNHLGGIKLFTITTTRATYYKQSGPKINEYFRKILQWSHRHNVSGWVLDIGNNRNMYSLL